MKIFISYGREDIDSARRLRQELGDRGYDVWIDRESLLPGQRWKDTVIQAIRAADAVLVLLSQRSVGRRGFLNREIREALEVLDEQPDATPFLIPARLDDCLPSQAKLSEIHRVDLFPDWSEGMRQIFKALELTASTDRSRPTARSIRAFVQMQIDGHKMREIAASARQISGVIQADVTFGPYDLMVVVGVDSVEGIAGVLARLSEIPGVRGTSSHLVAVTAA